MKTFTGKSTAKTMITIDSGVLKQVRIKCLQEDLKTRELVDSLLRAWLAGKIEYSREPNPQTPLAQETSVTSS